MKIAMLYGPGDLRLEEQDLETRNLAPEEVWVETRITAFKIGTDRGNYEGAEQVPGAPGYPRWVGDSNFGIVRGVGAKVTQFHVGDRVVSTMHHQSEYVAPASKLLKVPDGVHPEDGVFVNLYSLSAHCYHKALFRPGETVAVVGHEPWLSELIAWLVVGEPADGDARFRMKKGGVAQLRGTPRPGRMQLRALLPPKLFLE